MKNSSSALYGIIRFPGAFSLFLLVSLLLSACGSNGSGSSSSQTTVQTTAVAGIAAAGAPLSGKVHLSDSSSFKIYSSNSTINRDGSFSINTTGMQAPFILKAVDAAGNPLYYSFAKAPGIANINPLTNLALAVAAGAPDMKTLDDLYSNHTALDKNAVSGAITGMKTSLYELLKLYDADKTDPLYDPYQVNKQRLDGLFEQVAITISGGTLSITNKGSHAIIFTAPVVNITSGTVVTSNLPTPASYPTPGNAELTLKVQGNLPSGTLIKNVSFSVQLPLGISVTLDSSDPKGLTSVENTAIPTGTAAGANVYPAPSLSATNNILTVSMSSPAGFGVGDFIKIRCIVSSSSLMAATTPNSFSVTASQFYSDIYKNTKLKGLTIVPDKFAALP